MIKKPLLLGLIIYGFVIIALATRNGAMLALALPVMVYLAAGLLFKPEPAQLAATRHLSTDRAQPDQPVEVTLAITNHGPRLEEVLVEDALPPSLTLVNGQTRALTTLHPRQTITLQYTVSGSRGLYRFANTRLIARDYLGLFRRGLSLAAPNQFFVLPEIVKVKQVAIRPPRTGIYPGLIPARQGGPGIEFFGVREYQPGDPLRWVNERASARYQQSLFVNEFEQERMVDVGLILDARQQSDARRAGESLFEYSIQAAATLADTFLSGGNRVGLFIYGRSLDWTFPGYGKLQRERIIRALARAEQGEGNVFESLEHLPTRLFPVRSQLVLISPLLSPDLEMLTKLRARGYRILVISPNPVAFEQQGLKDTPAVELAAHIARVERTLLLAHLRQAGIRVADWQVDTPFHQVAHAALSRFPMQRGHYL